jgi:hypothetical protein
VIFLKVIFSNYFIFLYCVQSKTAITLLSTDLGLSPTHIIEIYGMRFSLEFNLRDAKQYFGFGDYQCQRLTAMNRYVALSLISLCLWRLVALTNLAADWLPPATETTPLSFRRLSCDLRSPRRDTRRTALHHQPNAARYGWCTAPLFW